MKRALNDLMLNSTQLNSTQLNSTQLNSTNLFSAKKTEKSNFLIAKTAALTENGAAVFYTRFQEEFV